MSITLQDIKSAINAFTASIVPHPLAHAPLPESPLISLPCHLHSRWAALSCLRPLTCARALLAGSSCSRRAPSQLCPIASGPSRSCAVICAISLVPSQLCPQSCHLICGVSSALCAISLPDHLACAASIVPSWLCILAHASFLDSLAHALLFRLDPLGHPIISSAPSHSHPLAVPSHLHCLV